MTTHHGVNRFFRSYFWVGIAAVLAAGMAHRGWSQESSQDQDSAKPLPSIGYTDTSLIPNTPWRVHDLDRPRPRIVNPGDFAGSAPPPSDAVVLFDGTDLSQWRTAGEKPGELFPARWKVENGYMEVAGGTGSIRSALTFGDCQIHLEWATPQQVVGSSQQRGNSGVIIMGRYEVQVLDSYNNITYADGQAAAIYGQYPPYVNASRPPGQWQSYDIVFETPRFEGQSLVQPGYVTVFHNGVLVQYRRALLGTMRHAALAQYEPHPPAGPLVLQDHGNPTRYRNIWVRPLELDSRP